MPQSEAELENALIAQLVAMGYESVRIDDETAMRSNLKRQLERHNQGVILTPAEFERVLNHLTRGRCLNGQKFCG